MKKIILVSLLTALSYVTKAQIIHHFNVNHNFVNTVFDGYTFVEKWGWEPRINYAIEYQKYNFGVFTSISGINYLPKKEHNRENLPNDSTMLSRNFYKFGIDLGYNLLNSEKNTLSMQVQFSYMFYSWDMHWYWTQAIGQDEAIGLNNEFFTFKNISLGIQDKLYLWNGIYLNSGLYATFHLDNRSDITADGSIVIGIGATINRKKNSHFKYE